MEKHHASADPRAPAARSALGPALSVLPPTPHKTHEE